MNTKLDQINSNIAVVQERFDWILSQTEQICLEPELLTTALAELSIALEELNVQQEELEVQQQELINSRQEIELQRQKYQDLFQFAPDAYIVTDIKGIIQEANQAAQALFKRPYTLLLQKPLILLVKKEDYQAFHTQLYQLCSQETGKHQLKDWEICFQAQDGKVFPAAIAVSPVSNSHNEIIGLRWLIRDISDQKAAEAALINAKEAAEIANQAKDHFLANISHEIRTPMTSIMGFAQLLLGLKLTQKQRDWIEQIDRASRKLIHLIDNILNFAKIASSQVVLKETRFNIRNFVKATSIQFTPQITAKNLTVSSVIDPQIPETIKGDKEQIREILSNLINNAIKYTERGEINISVTLAAEQPPNPDIKLQFAVKDTGIGIPPDYLDQIFQRFCQVDNSWTRQYQGTGLGLAITQTLCQQMGGQIWVESAINQGSTFYFTIIAKLDQAQNPNQLLTATDNNLDNKPQHQRASSLSILVVDDDPGIGQLILLFLEKLGYQADLITNPLEIMATVTKKYYDLIFMDLQMPNLDGLTATRQIRQQWGQTINYPEYPLPQIIALTANAIPETEISCQEAGMNSYISKPFNISDFASFFAKNKFNRILS